MKNALKVLIVDDDKASANMLSEIVKRLGFKPMVAHRSVDALNVVRLQTVHAALVDVLLPKMTGVELVKEFRKTKFGDNPVIFVSGVFKDKAFAAETLKETGGLDFLFKPFSVEEMTASLNRALASQVSVEKWSVQSLLTRKLNTNRERTKAIENLEEIHGFDFPFVLSILMDTGCSGHLNIVSDSGDIFGVSLLKGTISEVDSSESQATSVLDLISKGFLSQEDWDEFQKNGKRKFSLEKLVQEGYVSPHAVSAARHEQIMSDFRTICSAQSLQINFVDQGEGDEPARHAVHHRDMLKMLEAGLNDFFPESYLEQFYESVKHAPIRTVKPVSDIWVDSLFKDLAAIKELSENGGTLDQMLQAMPGKSSQVYQCMHYLVLSRGILFDDLNRAKNINAMLDRYKKLYGELKDKTPDKIYEYFGANATASSSMIANIFEEYSKGNHPDQLGKDATPELKELCKKCYDLVKAAHDVLTDESKKTLLFQNLKAQATEKNNVAMKLMADGLDMLKQGRASDALLKFKEASSIAPNNRLVFATIWAEIKSGGASVTKPKLHDYQRTLEAITGEDRKTAIFYMALGLVKKGLGDPSAIQQFERAIQLDGLMVEARREMNALNVNLQNNKTNKKNENIFTGDITEIVSQLFRRKPD